MCLCIFLCEFDKKPILSIFFLFIFINKLS